MLGDPQQPVESGGGGLGEEPGDAADEHPALEELGGVHQVPPEAHQRHRDLCPLLYHLLLANLSMRYKTRLDWDEKAWTVQQEAAKPYLKARYRSPWKLEV